MLQKPGGEGFAAVAPNTGELPYAVKGSPWELAGSIVLFGGGGLILFLMALLDPQFRANSGPVPIDLVCVTMWAVCGLRVWRLGTPSLVFHPDRLETREIRGWRSLARADIAGVGRITRTRYGNSWFMIFPKPGAGTPVRLQGRLRADPVIDRWLAGAPDPVVEAVKADRAAILADPRYGATQGEREARLALARTAMVAFNVMAVVVAIGLTLLGRLDAVSVGLATGVLAIGAIIVWTSKGLVVWFAANTARPVATGAVAPFAALIARTLYTVDMIDTLPALGAAAVIALATGALIAVRPRDGRAAAQAGLPTTPLAAVLIGTVAGLGAYGALMLADVAFDSAPRQEFPTTVDGKHLNRGRWTTYYLHVGPWNGRPAHQVSVAGSLYDRSEIGNLVCIAEHPGALGIVWFRVDACPSGG